MSELKELLRRVGLAGSRRAMRDMPIGRKMPATVTAYTANLAGGDNFGRTAARVRLDGTTRDVPAMVTLGSDLYPGDRVMVEFNPPHQFLVVGSIPRGSAGQCQVLHVPITTGLDWDGVTTITFDVDSDWLVNCGFNFDGDEAIPFPVEGTYKIGCSVRLGFTSGALAVAEKVELNLWYTNSSTTELVGSAQAEFPAGQVDPSVTLNTGGPIIYGGAGETLTVTSGAVNAGWSVGSDMDGLSVHRLCCQDINVITGGGGG